jgi:hypothetical protein
MNNYIPKLSHAVLCTIAGIIFTGLLAQPSQWEYAWLVGAIAFITIAALIFVLLFLEARRSFYNTMAYLAERLAQLNPDQWQAMGIAFPHLRIRWKGKPIQFFEDTQATLDDFERFMRDSNTRQISPERNWSSGPDRRAWREIAEWLIANKYIYEQSASGNHSWLWRGNMHALLWQRYIEGTERTVPNLNEVDGPIQQEVVA